jgi:hypothetical protein
MPFTIPDESFTPRRFIQTGDLTGRLCSVVDAPLAGVLQCLQREERNRSTLTVITKSLPYLNDDNNNDNEVCVRGQGLVTR